jgi:hypothetical protein
MQTVSQESHGDPVPGEPRIVRFALLSTLFVVAGIYVWYCAPLGATVINAAVVALLAIAAAAFAAMSARFVFRLRRYRLPRQDVGPAERGVAV